MDAKRIGRWIVPTLILLVAILYNPQIGSILIAGYVVYVVWSTRSGLLSHLAVRKYRQADFEGALRWFSRAAANKKANATVVLSYALVLLKVGDFDAARACLDRVADQELSDYSKDALAAMRGVLEWKQGSARKAAADLGKLAEESKNANLFGALGALYISIDMLDAAYQIGLEAREFDPYNDTIADNLGRTLYLRGQIDEAEEIFDELIEREARLPEPYLNKALILESRGETEEAAGLVARARDIPYSHLSYYSPEDIELISERIEAKAENTPE